MYSVPLRYGSLSPTFFNEVVRVGDTVLSVFSFRLTFVATLDIMSSLKKARLRRTQHDTTFKASPLRVFF